PGRRLRGPRPPARDRPPGRDVVPRPGVVTPLGLPPQDLPLGPAMPYPRKLLNDGEDIVLDLHQHWWSFAQPTLAFVAAVALAIAVGPRVDNNGVRLALLALMALTVLWWIGQYVKWATTNFVVTNERLVFRSGVLGKRGREIPLDRLNDISFHQSFFERIIGAGDLMIESAGEKGQEQFTD